MLNFLTIKEVAEVMKVSTGWVRCHADKLGGSRIGSKLIFTQEGINHAVQRGQEVESMRSSQRKAVDITKKYKTRSKRVGNKEKGGVENSREAEIRDELLESLQ